MLDTLVFPESVSIISVEITISFFVTPSKNRFREISAVSTAREIALPRALIATVSAPLLNCVTTANYVVHDGFVPDKNRVFSEILYIVLHDVHRYFFLAISSAFSTLAPAAPRIVLCPIAMKRTPSRNRPTDTVIPPPRIRSSRGCGRSASSSKK